MGPGLGAAVAVLCKPVLMLFVLAVACVVYGVVVLVRPEIGWQISMFGRRWQFKDGDNLEPSRAGLIGHRIAAVLVAALGIVFGVLAYTYNV